MVVLETFLLLNGVLDACLLWSALWWLDVRPIRTVRLVCSACCGALYAYLAYLPGGGFLHHGAVRIACAGILCRIAAGRLPLRRVVCGAGFLCVSAWLTGGVAASLQRPGLPVPCLLLCSVPLALAAAIVLRRKRYAPQVTRVLLEIVHQGLRVCLQGIVDTGNGAQDPYTGLPVILIPAESLCAWLPIAYDPLHPETLPQGMRLLHVHTAAGSRLLPCFRPDTITAVHDQGTDRICATVAAAPRGMLRTALVPPTALAQAEGSERRPA